MIRIWLIDDLRPRGARLRRRLDDEPDLDAMHLAAAQQATQLLEGEARPDVIAFAAAHEQADELRAIARAWRLPFVRYEATARAEDLIRAVRRAVRGVA